MTTSKVSPKDFFLYVAVMVTLYVSAISILTLLFQIINTLYPDVLQAFYDPYSGAIRWAIASLIIIFPLYIFFSWLTSKDLVSNPSKEDLWVRKWLIYITLFLAGATIAIDLIVLLNRFLGGEISIRFILKVIAVLIVAAGIFSYYIFVLKGKEKTHIGKSFAWGSSVFIIISVIVGFVVMGSPSTQRALRLDQQRVSDLQTIQWQVTDYWQRRRELPTNLDALRDEIGGISVPTDPETGESYEYRAIDDLSFELCADFKKTSVGNESRVTPYYGIKGEDFWEHESGRECFKRDIDPAQFPPRTG